ncbi:tetratricopeptide repeat protein [Spirulina sp. CS-785/01]|uniref:tetratricopeptide repeat protein n=1 Tax=Spirulina sp. CS-785/01 TaxID=3021716 RepID=UPI00232BC3BD|nr:tetratricopeptide repeat protein [Spirulina sp. CS-785/01]MDB9313675.1 tetratricopeptide repeat protein [Spirulina sp. CS-785/01]
MPFRWVQDLFSDLISSDPPIPDPSEIQPLTYEAYESLFYQLLDGVARGWQQTQILERLGIRRYDPWFVAWLQRYGRQLLRQSPSELESEQAQRMIRLGNMNCGELGDVAKQIGERMLELGRQEGEKYRQTTTPVEVSAVSSEDPMELFQQGALAYQAGEFQGAVSLWEAALERQDEFFDAQNGCGAAYFYLGQYDRAIAHLNQALQLQPDSPQAAFNRGNVYLELQQYDQALADFSQALEKQGDLAAAYQGRGMAYYYQERYKEALEDLNQGIALKSDFAPVYNSRGMVQAALGDYEAALRDLAAALSIDPNLADAYHNRGNVLRELGRYEAAVADYSQAILLHPNFPEAHYSRGNTFMALGRYGDALKDYQEALTLKPDYPHAYNGQGVTLRYLGRYNDALDQFNKAVEIDPNFWQAWGNRGWTIFQAPAPLGYEAALQNWQEGLSRLAADHPDYPLAAGTLHHYQGMAHYREGLRQGDARPYLEKAIAAYQKALDAWQDDPKLQESYLEVMQELITAHHDLGNYINAKNYINIALIILKQLVLGTESSRQKLRLERKFIGLRQLRVDQLAQASDRKQQLQGLQFAEEEKNLSIHWQLQETVENVPPSPTALQMQRLLDEETCLVYWHLSPAALTTFILRDQQPVTVLPERHRALEKFTLWFEKWQRSYERKRQKVATPDEKQWQTQLESYLQELGEILQVETIVEQLPEGCRHLILIPHLELHLLPLPVLFAGWELNVTTLPSAKFGLDLQDALPSPDESPPDVPLLLVENPSGYMPHGEIEISAIAPFFAHRTLQSAEANKVNLVRELQLPTNIFHFTGKSYQNTAHSLNAALILAQQEEFTLQDILTLEDSLAPLICLSASEMRLTHPQRLTNEFVSLATAILTKSASYVLHSLWSVPEVSTSLLMWQFYQFIKQEIPPHQALTQAQTWLKHLTYRQLIEIYDHLLETFQDNAPRCQHHLKVAQDLAQDKANRQGEDHTPYASPYYWAGFLITGKIN